VIGILSWPQTARLVRSQFLRHRTLPYVDAARVLGMRPGRIIFREILPNVLAPVIVVASLDIAQAILLEASLGFFGLGDPNLRSWGGMLNTAQGFVQRAWWMSVFPGVAISLAVLGFNLLRRRPQRRDRSAPSEVARDRAHRRRPANRGDARGDSEASSSSAPW
jgi:peptide/nickel transport system permease protein